MIQLNYLSDYLFLPRFTKKQKKREKEEIRKDRPKLYY